MSKQSLRTLIDVSYWDKYVSTHLFKPDNGFLELPYFSNNGPAMAESLGRLSISHHQRNQQAIYTHNDVLTGEMRYRELDDGLWILASNFDVHKNFISKALYDRSIPADHYFLSFAVFEYPFPAPNKTRDFSTLISTTCTFYKPGTEVHTFFYEKTKGTFFNLVFTKAWAENNLRSSALQKAAMSFFLNDDAAFLNWIEIVPNAIPLSTSLWERLEMKDGIARHTKQMCLEAMAVISDFFKLAYEEERLQNFESIHNPDFALVARAEQIILLNLTEPFIGVEKIARAVNLSPTKLKRIFKAVFGFSILQYHKEKNMLLARQLLENNLMPVNMVATITGYNSASKFTAAFKKRFGLQPAQVRKLK